MHSDHTVGLSDKWDPRGRPIYCSAVTKALLLRKFPALATRADVRVLALDANLAHVVRLRTFSKAGTKRKQVVNGGSGGGGGGAGTLTIRSVVAAALEKLQERQRPQTLNPEP
jgi:hypothetical protein